MRETSIIGLQKTLFAVSSCSRETSVQMRSGSTNDFFLWHPLKVLPVRLKELNYSKIVEVLHDSSHPVFTR